MRETDEWKKIDTKGKREILKTLLITLTSFALAATSQASFILVDDMEGANNWTYTHSGSGFVADPAGSANTVFAGQNPYDTVQNFYRSIPTIASGTTATLFMRVRSTADARTVDGVATDLVFGLSDSATPSDWINFEGYARLYDADAAAAIGVTMEVRNGSSDFVNVGTASADAWFNVWMVIDNTAQTTDIYFNTGAVDATDASTQSYMDGGFRRGDGNDLVSLFVRNNQGVTTGYIDDIYIDTTGENLISPLTVSEPGTVITIY